MGYGRTWLEEIVIIALFDYFAPVTNELNLFLPPRFPCRKDAQKPFLFGTWSLYFASNGKPITTVRELTAYFLPFSYKCDYAGECM